MNLQRRDIIKELEDDLNGAILSIVSAKDSCFSYSLDVDLLPVVDRHLSSFSGVKHLILFLDSGGGDLHLPMRLIELIRSYCEDVTVVVAERAYSAATLLALGCDKVLMGRASSLTPIDPNIFIEFTTKDGPKNLSYSSGDLHAFLKCGDKDRAAMLAAMAKEIPPSLIGKALRNYQQSRLIGRKMLGFHFKKNLFKRLSRQRVVNRLIEGYFSHDYLLSVAELKEIGLNAFSLSTDMERRVSELLIDYRQEMAVSDLGAIVEDGSRQTIFARKSMENGVASIQGAWRSADEAVK